MRIRVVRDDITRQSVEAIVTAANTELRGGGGVDGAVHLAAGPELLRACRPLAPCPTGSAVVTPAYALAPVRWVIHAVGPVYSGPDDEGLLQSAYVSAIRRAEEVGARSVAFPSISTGVYGYPERDAAYASVAALTALESTVQDVVLVAFGPSMHQHWSDALAEYDLAQRLEDSMEESELLPGELLRDEER